MPFFSIKTLALIFLASSFASGTSGPARAASVTFEEAFESARRRNESVAIQATRVELARETLSQARGSILPSLGFNTTYTRQDRPESGTNAFTRPDQTTVKLTLNQPLFRGFREFAALRAAGDALDASLAASEQTRLALYSQVGAAFYSVLAAEKDLANVRTLVDLTAKRVSEIRSRVRIGRSRRGELFLAESQAMAAQAQLSSVEVTLKEARNDFAFVTGLPQDTNLIEMAPGTALSVPAVPALPELLAAREKRPDIRVRLHEAAAADEQVAVARGGHLPSIDFFGNYYLKRTGVLEDTKWDLGISLSFPIFQGGVISSQTRSARQREVAAQLELERLRRFAESEIRTAHEALEGAIRQVSDLEQAVAAAEKNYQEATRDYSLGLTTNLDVIQAMNSYVENKRTLDRTKLQIKLAQITLQAAAGELPGG